MTVRMCCLLNCPPPLPLPPKRERGVHVGRCQEWMNIPSAEEIVLHRSTHYTELPLSHRSGGGAGRGPSYRYRFSVGISIFPPLTMVATFSPGRRESLPHNTAAVAAAPAGSTTSLHRSIRKRIPSLI